MKNIFKTIVFLMVIGLLTGCHDITTEGFTKITHYPSFTMQGDNPLIIELGATFTDPGVIAMEGDDDITDKVNVSGSVNTNEVGFYSLTYSAINKDGFAGTARRQVVVVNPAPAFASAYWGESEYGVRHYFNAPIVIKQKSDGAYQIDDLAGGFYFNGRYPGYEPNYDFHLEAVLKLESDNTITLGGLGSWYWDGADMSMTSGIFDPDTQTITMELDFGGAPMYVTLIGVQ